MKKKLRIFLLLAVLVLVFALTGCTEAYKQAAIPGNYADLVVDSESGLVTKVTAGGKSYLYFVNGVAGQTVENNTFGSVVKGAIARVELDANGNPILTTKTIVVPKNIFATDVDSSFTIRGGYLYYTTPSVVKDKDGKAKTAEMVLMRTSLDGTKTEIIRTFTADDGAFSNVYRVTSNEVVYYYKNAIHRIDLNNKKFPSTEIVAKVAAYKFVKGADYVVYTKTLETSNYSNEIMLLPFSATAESGAKVLIDIKSYKEESLAHPLGYTLTINSVQGNNDSLNLFYSKTDSGTTKISEGIYRYNFDLKTGFVEGRYTFNEAKEERITAGKMSKAAYTQFDFIDENTMFATEASGIYYLVKEDSVNAGGLTLNWKVYTEPSTLPGEAGDPITANIEVASVKFLKYEVKDGKARIYYLNGTNLQRRILFAAGEDGILKLEQNTSEDLYTMAATTSWLNYQIVGNNLYFINSNAGSYTYYVDMTTFKARDAKSYSNILLSKVSLADKIALLKEKPVK